MMPANHIMPHTEESKREMALSHIGVPCPWNRQQMEIIYGIEYFKCSKCHQFLPKGLFYKDKRILSGIKSQCKKCHCETVINTRNIYNNRRLHREHEARRRAWKLGNNIEPVSFKVIELRDHMICGLCGKKVKQSELSFDHIIPLSCGGAHAEWNIQVSHLLCNIHKKMGTIPSQTRLQITGFTSLGR